MSDDRDLTQQIETLRNTLRTVEEPPPLDPAVLVARSHRRTAVGRTVKHVVAAVSGIAVLAAAVVAVSVLGPHGAPVPASPVTSPVAAASASTPSRSDSPASSTTPSHGGTVAPSTWVEIAPSYWFATFGTQWCIVAAAARPSATTAQGVDLAEAPFGCRDTVHNADLGSTALSSLEGSGDAGSAHTYTTSVFTGSPVSTTWSVHGQSGPGTLWKLEGIPGWYLGLWIIPMAVWTPNPSSAPSNPVCGMPTVTTYDASGAVDGQAGASQQAGC